MGLVSFESYCLDDPNASQAKYARF